MYYENIFQLFKTSQISVKNFKMHKLLIIKHNISTNEYLFDCRLDSQMNKRQNSKNTKNHVSMNLV